MSVETDLAYVQKELRAMKAYARPMLDLLVQKTLTIPASGSIQDRRVTLQFTDDLQHMVWMIPGGCNGAAVEQTTGAGLIVWSVTLHAGNTGQLVFSSFNDYTVALG